MSSKVSRVSNSKKNTQKKTTLNRNRNLVYMAKPPYGGWVSCPPPLNRYFFRLAC